MNSTNTPTSTTTPTNNPKPTPHPNFTVCKPPHVPTLRNRSIFLAGSIEMGKAIQWQRSMEEVLSPYDLTLLNPRRGNWDASLVQDISCGEFRGQVEWELDCLDACTAIVMYFDPRSKAPISLLELGLYARSGRLLVCCPVGFWRRGNVQIVCERFGVPLVETLEQLVEGVLERVGEKGVGGK
ncbi:hypothetical protein AOQ84DRAFT_296783 [Glonium stellatum]|uniref:Nucleoside 2-deoxyribosyltransferase domain-containing protein n=1 Tax=Glonium stellatum TaxID=574774 RepID=A0A8E2JRB3_9PEZI|nr:hypothetical protein AOQ84DRAFT_296783 [Glonium stellatum]